MATSPTPSTAESKSPRGAKRKAKVSSRRGRVGHKSPEGFSAQLYRQSRDVAAGAYDSATKMGRKLPKQINQLHLGERAGSLYSMMEERPLVLGVVGLGVGMVLAAILPSMTGSNSQKRRR